MIRNVQKTVKLNEKLLAGTVISYDESLEKWSIADNNSNLLAVVKTEVDDSEVEEDGSCYVSAEFKGFCEVITSRDIPKSGGKINIENGKVFIDNSQNTEKFILPYDGNLITQGQKIIVIF